MAGTLVFFGSDEAPFEEKDRFLAGTWSGPAPDGEITLELATDGRYALVTGSAGGATVRSVECGKWRYRAGSLQMRSKKHASLANTLLLRQPGLRAGSVEHHAKDDRITLTLLAAKAGGANEAAHWDLSRREEHVLPLCD